MKSSSVAGIPVCLETGQQVAVVKLVVFDPDQHTTLGFLVGWGGWTGSAKVLPCSAAICITDQAIEITSANQIVPVSQVPQIRNFLEGPSLSKGTHVITADGYMVGVLQDVHFDPRSYAIFGYEMVFTRWGAVGQRTLLTPDQIMFDPQEAALVIPTLTTVQLQELARNSG